MLKFAVLLAAFACATQAQDAKPTPDPKSCRFDYLKDVGKCANVPELLNEADFKKCGPPKGKYGKGRGFPGGPGGFPGGRPPFDMDGPPPPFKMNSNGEAPEGDAAPEALKSRRGKREAHRGGKAGKFMNGRPPFGKPPCFNCMMECVFNNSGLLDNSGSVDIAAVQTTFGAKATNAPWADLVKSTIDSCWAEVQKVPAPTTVAPPAEMAAPPAEMPSDMPMPPPFAKKNCKQDSLYLMQCIQRALSINAPESEKNASVSDCDARNAHLKNCDPMIPGFMDFKAMGEKMKSRSGKRRGGDSEGAVAASARNGKRKGKKAMKMKAKRTTMPAPAEN